MLHCEIFQIFLCLDMSVLELLAYNVVLLNTVAGFYILQN